MNTETRPPEAVVEHEVGLYCPHCQHAGLMLVLHSAIAEPMLYCPNCPMITEIDGEGKLVRYGDLTMVDLQEPMDAESGARPLKPLNEKWRES